MASSYNSALNLINLSVRKLLRREEHLRWYGSSWFVLWVKALPDSFSYAVLEFFRARCVGEGISI